MATTPMEYADGGLFRVRQVFEYRNQTFGVISLVGDRQALEIERLLRHHIDPEAFETRRIICGNPAQFQGDERDVVFLSLVDVPTGSPLPMKQADTYRQRFNVAASRGRNQMWVVHSPDPVTDLPPGDLRRRLIEYALDPQAVERELEQVQVRAESEFERRVIERLVRARYRVRPQWPVGCFRIDIVVEGAGRRLAIECDGDRFHPIEKLPEDMARQAILERLGWVFVLLRGSEFFRNPDQAMERVFHRLEQLGIPAEGVLGEQRAVTAAEGDLLREAVVRRATELRNLWQAESDDGSLLDDAEDVEPVWSADMQT